MTKRQPTFSHRLEYALYRCAVLLSRLLGWRLAAKFGGVLGRLAYRPLGIRRDVVENNLLGAFPERDAEWRRRVAADAYAHLGREAFVLLRLTALGPEGIVRRTDVIGLPALREAMARGGGVVGVTGHIGNWAMGGAALVARGIPLDVIAQRQANPLVDAAINRERARLGLTVIDRARAPREAMRGLRANHLVAFLADQDARGAGVFVPFFGRPASTHRGAAVFALRANAPVFVVTALAAGNGRYRVRIERVAVDRSGDRGEVVRRLTAAFTERLESAVRHTPEQYFWHHRRWKTRPRAEPAAARSGI